MIDLGNAQPTTMAELIALSAPSPLPTDTRFAPTENTVFVVNATLTDFKLEGGSHGDSGCHLVLMDEQGNTMVAEIPLPIAWDRGNPFAAQISSARSTFDRQFTPTSSFQTANVPVQGTGVENPMEETPISKCDRVYGGLQGIALFTKPTTIKNVQLLTGKTETFVIQTARHNELGDHIFIACMDDSGVVRLALPPKVANAIASQRDTLTACPSQYCQQGDGEESYGARRSTGIHASEEAFLRPRKWRAFSPSA